MLNGRGVSGSRVEVRPVRVEVTPQVAKSSSEKEQARKPDMVDMEAENKNHQELRGKVFEVEKEEMPVEPLWDLPFFPVTLASFCILRALRLMLLGACFPEGPHHQDGAAGAAIAFGWLAITCCFMSAVLVYRPLIDYVEEQDLPKLVLDNFRCGVLWLMVVTAGLEVLHQLLALIRWQYFWGTAVLGQVDTGPGAGRQLQSELAPLAYVLVLFQAIGLFGTALLIGTYARCYRAAWRWIAEQGEIKKDAAPGRGAKVAPSNSGNSNKARGSRRGYRRNSRGEGSSAWQDAEEGRGQGGAAEDGPRRAASAASSADTPPGTPRSHGSGRAAASPGRPRYSPREDGPDIREPKNAAGAGKDKQPSAGQRAWLWDKGEWVKVRILRSSSDGTATVRLSGGDVQKISQSMLNPRSSGDTGPPEPGRPPRAPSQPGRPPRPPGDRRDHDRGSAGSREPSPDADSRCGSRQSSRPSSAGGGASSSVAADAPMSEGEKWAAERMGRLRTELCELDKCSAGEKRSKLRALQRELHPDKQPPELRVHAQSLFHLVQREWEVTEAAQREAQPAASAPTAGG